MQHWNWHNRYNRYLSHVSIELTLSSDWLNTRLIIIESRKLINVSDSIRNSLLPRDRTRNPLNKVRETAHTTRASTRVNDTHDAREWHALT
jgi:hypothetical protein